MIWQLAWRNLWRHRTRTWITVIALMLTTSLLTFMLSFQFGSYETMKEQNLKMLSGYAQIQQAEFKQKPNLRHSFEIQPDWDKTLNQNSQLQAFGYRGQSFAIVSNMEDSAHKASLIMGVEPAKEPLLSSIPNRLIAGRYLNFDDHNQIIIGQELANKLKLQVGDSVQLLGQDYHGSIAIDLFEVVGIFDVNMQELNDQLIQMPLKSFQTLFAMDNRAQQLILVTDEISQAALLEEKLFPLLQSLSLQKLHWLNWQQLQPQLAQAIQLDLSSALVFYAALLLIVILILANTLYMSILERHNEFALLHALGLQPRQISRLLSLELSFSLFLSVFLGWLIGLMVTEYFIWVGITLPGTEEIYAEYGLSGTLYPTINLWSLGFIPIVFFVAAIILSFFIQWKTHSIKPLTGRQL